MRTCTVNMDKLINILLDMKPDSISDWPLYCQWEYDCLRVALAIRNKKNRLAVLQELGLKQENE